MNHKGYIGQVIYDEESGILHGEVINTRDVITFQGSSVSEIQQAFVDSVEDYLAFCTERGESPEKPFSGKFQLRLPPHLHQQAYARARAEGISLNELVKRAVEKELT